MLNFANPDMVGHTGDLAATIEAVEVVDQCIGKIRDALMKVEGELVIIADHGNAEKMRDPKTGSPYTAHTTNDVPCIIMSKRYQKARLRAGILADVAPTILTLMGIAIPVEMTGKSLFVDTRVEK